MNRQDDLEKDDDCFGYTQNKEKCHVQKLLLLSFVSPESQDHRKQKPRLIVSLDSGIPVQNKLDLVEGNSNRINYEGNNCGENKQNQAMLIAPRY
jgi:microcompartment protein CcmK/EutM